MENQTLIIALALVACTCSGALILNWLGNRHIPGLMKSAIGFTATSAGILLLTQQGRADPLVAILLANILLLGGRLLLVFSFAEFWNQENSRLPTLCAICYALSMAGIYYFTFVEESMLARIRLYGSTMVVISLSYAFLIVNGLRIEKLLRPIMSTSSNYGAALIVGLSLFNAMSEFILMFLRSGVPLAADDSATSMLLLGSIFSLVVLAFAIILMTADELSVELKENAIYDPVTTILNHRSFLEVGYRVLGVEYRNDNPVTLVTLQIDNMSKLIRRHGHKVVNEMLRYFAVMANDRRRNGDVLGRSSFDKFQLLLPQVGEKQAELAIQRMIEAQREAPFLQSGEPVSVEFRLCSVTRRKEDLELHLMLQESDVQLQYAQLHKVDSEAASGTQAAPAS